MSLADKKVSLHEKLQKAIELELSTIPPYLMAMFSIKQNTNVEAAVILRSVFMEEMLHMLLAANILSATGGSVKLGKNNVPEYPCRLTFKGESFRDREFDVNLEAFSKSAIDTFMQIELPQQPVAEEAEVLELVIEGYTIGEFYEGIAQDLSDLCDEFGEEAVFNGDPKNQVSKQYYWGGGGEPIVVTSLETARAAIKTIVEQGEGAPAPDKETFFSDRELVPHYYRFKEIYSERYYRPGDDPYGEPTGDKMEIDYSSAYPIKPNCKSEDFEGQTELRILNDLFNTNYSMMLHQLEEGFNGNPKVFYTAIMNGMRNLPPIARQIVQVPIKGNKDGLNAAPTFQLMMPSL